MLILLGELWSFRSSVCFSLHFFHYILPSQTDKHCPDGCNDGQQRSCFTE